MKPAVAAIASAAALLLLLPLTPGPGSPAAIVRADHTGEIVCPDDPAPVHDGVISPGEYSENFFDPTTKVLVYFDCIASTDREMHVGLVSPWSDWTELRIQAAEAWNGDLNVVRTSMSGSSVTVSDGFMNGTTSQYVDDLSAGGTKDVIDPAARVVGDVYTYEFGLPLLSRDLYDCQLTGNGSFYFQMAYVTVADPMGVESDIAVSDPQVIHIGMGPMTGEDTSVELSLPSGNAPGEPSQILVGLRDATDTPLAARPVSVFARTSFGFLDLGTVSTNSQGAAAVEYAPLGSGEYLIGAAFAGGNDLLASVSWARLVIPSPPPGSSFPLRTTLVVQSIIALVLGGVWVTYGLAVYTLRSAMREPRKPRGVKKAGGRA